MPNVEIKKDEDLEDYEEIGISELIDVLVTDDTDEPTAAVINIHTDMKAGRADQVIAQFVENPASLFAENRVGENIWDCAAAARQQVIANRIINHSAFQAMSTRDKNKAYRMMINAYVTEGFYLVDANQFDLAMELFSDLEMLGENIENKTDGDYRFYADFFFKMAAIYFRKEMFDESAGELQKAISYCARITDRILRSRLKTKLDECIESVSLVIKTKAWGFECKDMEHDGNCFFSAVLDQLKLQGISIYTHQMLRQLAASYLEQHFSQYVEYVLENERESYIKNNYNDGVWPDHSLMQALSEKLQMRFVIFNNSNESVPITIQPLSGRFDATLYLACEMDWHYYSAIRRPDWVPTKTFPVELSMQRSRSNSSLVSGTVATLFARPLVAAAQANQAEDTRTQSLLRRHSH